VIYNLLTRVPARETLYLLLFAAVRKRHP